MEPRHHLPREPRLGEFNEWAGYLSLQYTGKIDGTEIAAHTFSCLAGRRSIFNHGHYRLSTLFSLDSELGCDARTEIIAISRSIVEPYGGKICLLSRNIVPMGSIKSEIRNGLDLPQLMAQRAINESPTTNETPAGEPLGKIIHFPGN